MRSPRAILALLTALNLLNYLDRSLLLKYWPGGVASLDATAAVARRLARWVPAHLKARIFAGR